MATISWRGDAPAIAQQTTVTIGTYDATTTYKVTINGKTISTIAAGSGPLTATALAAAMNASGISAPPPEFQEITWTVNGSVITGTCDTPGKPFTLSVSVVTGTGTISTATPVANVGPSDVANTANWVGGALPVTGDDVVIAGGASLLYNLSTLSAVTLASLTVKSSFAPSTIGAPDVNVDNQTLTYQEYRGTRLAVAATKETIGLGPGGGSTLIRRDGGTVQHSIVVMNTGSPVSGQYAYDFVGTHASNLLTVMKGTVGVAAIVNGVVSTIATLQIGYVSNQSNDATVVIGDGVTLGSIIQSGGKLTTNCSFTSHTMTAGTAYLQTGQIGTTKTGTITTLNIEGGSCFLRSTGTVTTANVSGKGILDLTTDLRSRTITTINVYDGATISDTYQTNSGKVYVFKQCGLDDVKIDVGVGFTMTFS